LTNAAHDCDTTLSETQSVDDHTLGINMGRGECIRETGRQSFMPGKKDNKAGSYCFVWYQDGDGDCVRIGGSRLIHLEKDAPRIDCEYKDVADHSSYHFEWAKWDQTTERYVSLTLHSTVIRIS